MTGPDPEKHDDRHGEKHESAADHVRELAQEIQHEIEEVVERIPEPVRWGVRRILMVVLLSLVAVVVIALVSAVLWMANRTEWVAQEVALVLNQTLARRSDVILEMDDLRGNPFTGVRAIRPRLKFRDGRGAPLLEARELSLRYGAWSLLTGGSRPIVIEIEDPVFRIERGPDGKWRLPKWESRPSKTGPGPKLVFHLSIRKGRADLPAPYGKVEDLDLVAGVVLGVATRVELQRMTWSSGPWGSALRRLDGSVEAGDSIRVHIDHLETGDVALRARAHWKKLSPEHLVHLEVDRVRWGWLARVFDNGALDVPGEGQLVADLSNLGGWHGPFTADVNWNGLSARGAGRVQERLPGGWTVDGIDMVSEAGHFRGRFLYDRNAWSVGGVVEDGDPSQWAPLRITGWPKGDVAGRFVYSVETNRKFSRLDARLVASELAGWQADSARVRVEFPAPGSAAFEVRMLRRGGVALLSAATDPGGWSGRYEATDFPLDEWPDGRASGIRGTLAHGAGNVSNRADGLFVTGTLRGHSSEWLGARMAGWRLDGVDGRLLPTPDLTAMTRLENVMFLGLHFDSVAIGLGLGDRLARLENVTASAGDTVVALAGESRWGKDGWTARFDRASMRSRQFAWTAEPPLELAGDSRGVTFRRLIARDGEARLEVAGRWAGPGGSYDWNAHAERLDLSRLGLPDDLKLRGRADARLRVTGVSGDPRFRFEGEASGPSMQDRRADTLSLALEGRPHALDVERFGFGVAGGTLAAHGTIAGIAAAWPDSLTPARVLEWVRTAERWQFDAEARALPIEGAGRLHPGAVGWSGRLGGTARVNGSPAQPEFTVDLTATPLTYGSYSMDRARVRADYRGQTLEVRDFEMNTGTVASNINGRLPLTLALGENPTLPERPMQWEVRIPRGDLAVLPAFVPQIGSATGSFEMNARISGTPQRPELDGAFKVRDGVVRLAAREEVLEKVQADFRLDETRITLDRLTAVQGEHGTVNATGVVELDGMKLRRYEFDLSLSRFTASETGVYAAEIDGDLKVVNGPRVRGVSLPQVTGRVDVQRAAVLHDFTKQDEADLLAASTKPLFWTYRVDLNADDNLRWTPTDADIEFNADLTMEQTRDSLLIYGEMHAIRGTYYFTSTRFNIERADLTFDNVTGVNPLVDAVASTSVTGSCVLAGFSAEQVEAPHTITVQITGRANEPEVTFESDPDDWDEPCILRQITLGGALAGGVSGTDAREVGNSYLARAISRSLSPELEKTFRGYLNDWRLERDHAGGFVVGFSTQPVRNVNLRYQQRVTPGTSTGGGGLQDPFEQSVQAEYRLGRFLYIATQLVRRDQTSSSATGTTNDFNVKLKARWEY